MLAKSPRYAQRAILYARRANEIKPKYISVLAEQPKHQYNPKWLRSVFVEIFFGHIILGKLAGMNLAFVSIVGLLDACYNAGFKRVPLFEQLIDALGIGTLDIGQSLQVARLIFGGLNPS
jgi:hypothetical protein